MTKNEIRIKKCPICHSNTRWLYDITGFSDTLSIIECPNCKLQIQDHSNADEKAMYGEDYYTGKAEYAYRDERKFYKYDSYVHKARLKTISKFIEPPGRFLDIGCAFGGLVRAANDFGFKAEGLDLSPYASAQAREAGLKITTGELQKDTYPKESFDIVTMIEVMEHITDPVAYLKILKNIIKKNGLLVIQTANFNAWQAIRAGSSYHYYLPGHFMYYSEHNLKNLLSQHGFGNFRTFFPVDFSLIAKLKKSRGNFQSITDYLKWIKMALYHWKGRMKWKGIPLNSSMVLYAFRQ